MPTPTTTTEANTPGSRVQRRRPSLPGSGFLLALGIAVMGASGEACQEGALTSPLTPPASGLHATTTVSSYSYSGGAYGTLAYVDNEQGLVRAGRTAATGLDCVTTAGVDQKNQVAAAASAPLFSTGLIETQSQSLSLSDGPAAKTSATVHSLTMLGGAITADVVHAVSTTGLSNGAYYTSAAGSSFLNLRISGLPVGVDVAPNTRRDIPGVGTVVLNEQILTPTPSGARLTVNMIHVIMSRDNALLIPWGTNVFVANAESGVRATAGSLEGVAYGTKLDGGAVRLGESALSFMPCNGTDGETLQTEMGAVTYKNILAFAGVRSTSRGTIGATRTEGEMTSTITSVRLLDGIITADVVVADATVSSEGGFIALGEAGSRLAALRVNGVSVDATTTDQRIPIANVGTLWVHRVMRTATSIEVRMLELEVEVANSFDLPIGTHLQVGVARVGVR